MVSCSTIYYLDAVMQGSRHTSAWQSLVGKEGGRWGGRMAGLNGKVKGWVAMMDDRGKTKGAKGRRA